MEELEAFLICHCFLLIHYADIYLITWGFIQLEKNKGLCVWVINQNNTKKSQLQHMQDQALNWHCLSLCVYNTKLIWYFKFLLVVVFTLKSPWEHKTFIEWVRCVTAYGRVIAWEPGFSINIFFKRFCCKPWNSNLVKLLERAQRSTDPLRYWLWVSNVPFWPLAV